MPMSARCPLLASLTSRTTLTDGPDPVPRRARAVQQRPRTLAPVGSPEGRLALVAPSKMATLANCLPGFCSRLIARLRRNLSELTHNPAV